ncbi:hypothetical protein EI18_07790 [Enterococcus hirae]|nr:hypothetical protein EI18_07790 [Enterococcus hirae]
MPQVFLFLVFNFSEQLFSLILAIIVKVVSILLILSFNQSFFNRFCVNWYQPKQNTFYFVFIKRKELIL